MTFGPGQNDVLGQTGKAGTITDRDYFTFTTPHGFVLKSLIVLNSVLPAGANQFIGLERGADITIDPTDPAPDPGTLLGYKHFNPGDIGHDILAFMGAQSNAQGFTPPLGEGTYSVWVQDTNLGASIYGLEFVVVPGPATALLTLAGLAGLVGMRSLGNRIGRRRTPARAAR